MNRRKAIGSLFLLAGAGVASYTGLRFYKLYKTPELASLPHFKTLIDELAETIIPRTHTPGAKDAQVGDFIIRMITDCTSKKEQNTFLYGLHDVDVVVQTAKNSQEIYELKTLLFETSDNSSGNAGGNSSDQGDKSKKKKGGAS